MRKKILFMLLSGACAGAAFYFRRQLASSPQQRLSSIRTEDLYYGHLSPKEVASQDLIDLNEAGAGHLSRLGLEPESLQRLVENRPYRSKLELVSRMILSEDAYSMIRDRIAVGSGDEPVKTA